MWPGWRLWRDAIKVSCYKGAQEGLWVQRKKAFWQGFLRERSNRRDRADKNETDCASIRRYQILSHNLMYLSSPNCSVDRILGMRPVVSRLST